MNLSGWGRYPTATCSVLRPGSVDEVLLIAGGQMITRGEGRSYGDAALSSSGSVILCDRLKRVIDFDNVTGVVTAEAGMTLAQLLSLCVPRGWFPPVTPGTKHVSL